MVWSGVNGLSRGDHNAGVVAGESMLSFVPLVQGANERSENLVPWIKSWATRTRGEFKTVKVQTSTEWCDPHQGGGPYFWLPPPAAAATAVE
jgi:hypothetical protein